MKVLLVGASGFLGRHLASAFAAAGHEVLRGVRSPRRAGEVAADFSRDTCPDAWLPRLERVEAVVNSAGIFREAGSARFEAVHDAGPRALFAACEAAGCAIVVQVSALGADERAASRFHVSKRNADDFLRATRLDWCVLQPSIVFGPGGASGRRLAMLAALPLVPLPGGGGQRVQPIHVDDLCALAVRVLADPRLRRRTIAAVGPRAVTIREWLGLLRLQMNLGPARFVSVPLALAKAVAGREAIEMLERGNTAAAGPVASAIGRGLRPVETFVPDGQALADRARLDWLLPLLRAMVAITWIGTAAASLLHPVEDSLGMLARVGLAGPLAHAALYAAIVLDILLGVAVYALRRRRRWLWRAQLALIAGYSAIIAAFLPEYWLHPFGPLLKNLPLMAAILLLHEFEPRERWTT